MKIIAVLLMTLAVGTGTTAMAKDDVSVAFGIFTDHLGDPSAGWNDGKSVLNERNDFVAVTIDDWFGGHMVNSFGFHSWFFGRRFNWEHQRLNYGISPAFITGYDMDKALDGKLFDKPDPYADWEPELVIWPVFHAGIELTDQVSINGQLMANSLLMTIEISLR